MKLYGILEDGDTNNKYTDWLLTSRIYPNL